MSRLPIYSPRQALLQHKLAAHQAAFLTDPHDIAYFCGFQTLVPEEREAYLIITAKDSYLLYSSFSPLPEPLAAHALAGTFPSQVAQHLAHIKRQSHITELLVDTSRLYVVEHQALTDATDLKLQTLDKKWLWELRQIKDGAEIDTISQAAKIAAQAYAEWLPHVEAGVSERQLQQKLENLLRELGSSHPAFPTIVAFGPHTALPHHQPGELLLENDMPILVDFGATVDGYRSDMTRSSWYGNQPDPSYIIIKNTVDEAYQAVMDTYSAKVKAGQTPTASDLDIAAREVITQAGFGEHFIHTTGHGVGLDIHEPPSISSRNNQVLKPNMVLTNEPGIYLPNRFGYRYENTVLVTESELVELTVLQ